jgi:outer membrane protease
MTLIQPNSPLTEQLKASITVEQIKRSEINIKRASRYLRAAQEGIRRYSARMKQLDNYDWRDSFETKEELLRMAIRNMKTFENCMSYYKQILAKELSK